MNRQQRRAQQKATPAWRRGLTDEGYNERLAKNGITVQDVQRACEESYKGGFVDGQKTREEQTYREGFTDGHRTSSRLAQRLCYAAMVEAAHERFGFGPKRLSDLLAKVDEIVDWAVDDGEVLFRIEEKYGYCINFEADVFDSRVEWKDGKK